MKKIISTILFVAATLAMSLPASSIELSPDATNVPVEYAKIVDGNVVYDKTSTAYDSITFNAILNAYGLSLAPEAVPGVPTSYAKVVDDKVVFNDNSIAYAPEGYHSVFTAYGLELSPEDAATLMGAVTYCKVVDDKIIFDKTSIAYCGEPLATILAAYKLPMMAIVETDCIDSDGDTVCDEIDVCGATPKGVKVDERGCWTLEQTYLFDFDKAEVKADFYPLLDNIAKTMSDNPKVSVQIEGHTDSVGSEAYNQGLSERRANAIKSALVQRNSVDAGRLNTVGFGESKPITTNDTADGRAKNRRVTLKPNW
jgi:outer membrane protein OmpA-like peptidoglycan-associated protein